MRALARRVVAGGLEQLGHHGLDAFQRVGNGARLLEDFLLHVVAVRPQLGRAAHGLHGAHRALHGLAVARHDPVLAQLHVHRVAFFQVDDLVGHAGQGHGVAGQKVLLAVGAEAQHQRRALARAHQALRLVAVQHGDGIAAAQALDGRLHRRQQVAVVQAVDEVDDDLGVGLAGEEVAARQQLGAQGLVVFDDAVVHQRDARRAGGGLLAVHAGGHGAAAEMRVRVADGRCAVRGPAGVGNAGAAGQALRFGLRAQVGHAGDAAQALQARARHGARSLGRMHGHAARVVAAVFEPLQALHEEGNDVARGDRADDAAHGKALQKRRMLRGRPAILGKLG